MGLCVFFFGGSIGRFWEWSSFLFILLVIWVTSEVASESIFDGYGCLDLRTSGAVRL